MDQDGWLDPSVFLLFNRIKNLNASLADIILACKSSDELEVSSPGAASFGDDAGQTRVRRSPDLPDFRNDDDREVARSFILRRIPQDSTVDSLLELFKPLGHVSYARIYRSTNFPDGPRALVCFPDQESADAAFLKFTSRRPPALEGILMKKRGQNQGGFNPSSPDFSVRPNMLICHFTELSPDLDWKRLYKTLTTVFTERIGDGTMRYLMYVPKADECHVTCNDNGATRALLAELTETGLVIEDSTAKVRILEDEEEVKNYWKMAAEHRASRNATRTRDSTSSSFEPIDRRPPGVIVKIDGLHEEMTWRDLKQDLSRLGKLVYLNHERGSNSCYVRFSTAEESSRVVDALSGPDAETICGTVVQSSVVAGEEETEYWNRAEELQRDRRNSRDSPPYES
ncbi:unnamed protein product [Chondrus crispus]|uniref:RRM domain-containing protein n=1 Tax=Chondrus crispus TaxID=2769 RepID=R7QCD6_CHOCR|nr:unnamed protein product [Chondrus crispus]CDF35438.1 unnamed protein product [Chondrus crispus]|eukprot:XP_005715257.1 unnamed protein product [Chondrus crispus]